MIENFGMGSVTNCEQLKKFECKDKVCTFEKVSILKKDFDEYSKKCGIIPPVTTSPLIQEQKKVIKKITDLKITLQKKNQFTRNKFIN